jgi:hypothetical protein
MSTEIIVPQLLGRDQPLDPVVARMVRGEVYRLEATLHREQRRYGLDSQLTRDARGFARIAYSMAESPATHELARVAADARERRVRWELAQLDASPLTRELAEAELARLADEVAWTHPALAGLLDDTTALAQVALGPSAETAQVLVETLTRRRAALIRVRTVLTRSPELVWALAPRVQEAARQLPLSRAQRQTLALRVATAQHAPEGAELVRAHAVGAAAR